MCSWYKRGVIASQFTAVTESNPLGFLEQTLKDIIACEPLYDRVCKETGERLPFTQLEKVAAKGLELNIISEQEAALLRRAEQGRLRTINVDDFTTEELQMANAPKATKRAKKSIAA